MQQQFPNLQPKPPGAYVRNVHPCGHSDEEGVVLQAEEWPDRTGGTLTVATGIGGTTYGPAENWQPIATRPAWIGRALEAGNDRAVRLLEIVERAQEEALEALTPTTAVVDVDAGQLALAWPAARRHATTSRRERGYWLIGVVLEQKHDEARRRARRAELRTSAA